MCGIYSVNSVPILILVQTRSDINHRYGHKIFRTESSLESTEFRNEYISFPNSHMHFYSLTFLQEIVSTDSKRTTFIIKCPGTVWFLLIQLFNNGRAIDVQWQWIHSRRETKITPNTGYSVGLQRDCRIAEELGHGIPDISVNEHTLRSDTSTIPLRRL